MDEGRWITTKNGYRVFLKFNKSFMDSFIRQKGGEKREQETKEEKKKKLFEKYPDMEESSGKTLGVRYRIKPEDTFNYLYAKDVTKEQLNNGICKLILHTSDEYGRVLEDEYYYANKKDLFDSVYKEYGGFTQMSDKNYTIMSEQGEFYLVRDRYAKGGWTWQDVNGSDVERESKSFRERKYE